MSAHAAVGDAGIPTGWLAPVVERFGQPQFSAPVPDGYDLGDFVRRNWGWRVGGFNYSISIGQSGRWFTIAAVGPGRHAEVHTTVAPTDDEIADVCRFTWPELRGAL